MTKPVRVVYDHVMIVHHTDRPDRGHGQTGHPCIDGKGTVMTGQGATSGRKTDKQVLFIRDVDGWVDSVTDVIIMPDSAFYDMFTPIGTDRP